MSPALARFCRAKAEAACPLASASARDPALERGDALLEHVVGRVHDAGVDVAELFQREQVRRMLCALKLVRGRLVDRHRDRTGRRVGAPACVERQRFRLVRHRFLSGSRRVLKPRSRRQTQALSVYYVTNQTLMNYARSDCWNNSTIAVRPRARKATARRSPKAGRRPERPSAVSVRAPGAYIGRRLRGG